MTSLLLGMLKNAVWVILVALLLPQSAEAVRARVDRHEIVDGVVYADVGIGEFPSDFLQELQDGMEKRLEFQVELFRVWNLWMDEFIGGVQLVRTIKYDLLKDEYRLYLSGVGSTEHRMIKDRDTALRLLTRIENVPVLPVTEAQRGTYYVRLAVQSRVRELPPVVGGLFFFIPEIEFHAEGRSPRFSLNK